MQSGGLVVVVGVGVGEVKRHSGENTRVSFFDIILGG
jgi:hypothetical protein